MNGQVVISRKLGAALAVAGLLHMFWFRNVSADAVDAFWFREGELNADLISKVETCVVIVQNDTTDGMQTGLLTRISSKAVVLTNYHLLKSTADAVSLYLTDDKGKQQRFRLSYLRGDKDLDLVAYALVLHGESVAWLKDVGFDISTLPDGTPGGPSMAFDRPLRARPIDRIG